MRARRPIVRSGADRLLEHPEWLAGRRYALLGHAASVATGADGALLPLHLALAALGSAAPRALFAPEHGYWGIEQDMVASADARDPWTGVPVRSLYGDRRETLLPRADSFEGIDLLLLDLQDVGSRYYTYAATAIWAAEAALGQGIEVWVLDRPNPLGGCRVEGNLPSAGLESFVSAFKTPVCHGLTLGELVRLEAQRRGWDDAGLRVVKLEGWRRDMRWAETGLAWIAPSPNMPTAETAEVYPGACLVEATTLSEGRGTTRPFQLIGAPGLDPRALLAALGQTAVPGVDLLPAYFRPQFQKHAGARCGGLAVVVRDARVFAPYRLGVTLLAAVRAVAPEVFAWRQEPYEFVADIPAIDLLTGGTACRTAIDAGGDAAEWVATWAADEAAFRIERDTFLLYRAGAGE